MFSCWAHMDRQTDGGLTELWHVGTKATQHNDSYGSETPTGPVTPRVTGRSKQFTVHLEG